VTLFPFVYFGNIQYFRELVRTENPVFALSETFLKQSFRSRCEIYGANGKQTLSVPVIKTKGSSSLVSEIAISYAEDWQKNHWKSIRSAYGKSPYFEHYEDAIKDLIFAKYAYLHELNLSILKQCLKWLEYEKEIILFNQKTDEQLSKLHLGNAKITSDENFKKYHQVFEEKQGHFSNLSFLDLIFNEGKNSQSFIYQ
jgi:hypothetical protein